MFFQGLQIEKPTDVYSLLHEKEAYHNKDLNGTLPTLSIPTKEIRARFSFDDFVRLFCEWKHILHR